MIREVRDRKGLPGDLSDGKSLAGRGGSKCKGPAAGAKFADTHKRPGVLGAGQARGRVARNEMSGVRAAGPVRTQKGSGMVKEATGPSKAGGGTTRCQRSLQWLCNNRAASRTGQKQGMMGSRCGGLGLHFRRCRTGLSEHGEESFALSFGKNTAFGV